MNLFIKSIFSDDAVGAYMEDDRVEGEKTRVPTT